MSVERAHVGVQSWLGVGATLTWHVRFINFVFTLCIKLSFCVLLEYGLLKCICLNVIEIEIYTN